MENGLRKPAIFLMGPTAAGKTDLAIELAGHLPIEIISVDSAMIYRGMDIGTGKPSSELQSEVPHHLMDIRDPWQSYSAADFVKDALQCMDDISKRGRIPCLVGGTMLYFRVLQQGLSPLPTSNPLIRAKLLEEARLQGSEKMHQRLRLIDPETANRIHPNDPQRIQRALEVYEISGRPLSSFFAESDPIEKGIKEYQLYHFALSPKDRAALHKSIEDRFHQMLEQGLVAEVKSLLELGNLNRELSSMRSVGYRQILGYLAGEYDYDQMVDKAISATRQLAKRQLTWLRNTFSCTWLQNNRLASLKSVIHCVSQGGFRVEPQ